MSKANIERLFKYTNPEAAAEEDPFLKKAKEEGSTPEFQKAMINGALALGHGTISVASITNI